MYYNSASHFWEMITLFAGMELHVLHTSPFGDDYSFCGHGTTCTTVSHFLGMITLFEGMELQVLRKSPFGDDDSFCGHGTTCTT